jgi:hypothetical protein
MIHDRLIALIYRTGSLIFTLFGLLSVMNVFAGDFSPSILVYYTIQSNFLALILFALLSSRTLGSFRVSGRFGETGYFARFEMVCVIDLSLTLIVYWTLLAPGFFTMNGPYSGALPHTCSHRFSACWIISSSPIPATCVIKMCTSC